MQVRRPLNIARRPLRAKSSADIITPAQRRRRRVFASRSYNGVSTAPGNTVVTLTPQSRSSYHSDCPKFRRNAFVEPYSDMVGYGVHTVMDDISRMRPSRRRHMSAPNSRHNLTGVVQCIAVMRSIVEDEALASLPKWSIPALLTRISTSASCSMHQP